MHSSDRTGKAHRTAAFWLPSSFTSNGLQFVLDFLQKEKEFLQKEKEKHKKQVKILTWVPENNYANWLID